MRKFLPVLLILAVHCLSAQNKRTLTLEECINIAIENNLTIQRSQLNLTSSEVDLLQSKAGRFPTLSGGGNFGYNWGRAIDPTTNQFTTNRIDFSGWNLSSSVPLVNGLRTTNTIKQRKLQLKVSKHDLDKAKNDVSINVSRSYLNVILNKELLENARIQLESSNQQLERTKKLVESGALPRTNQLELVSQVATNELNLITAQNNLDLALLALKQALLISSSEDIDLVIPSIEISSLETETNTAEKIYEVAVQNQPEIKSADLKVKSSLVGLRVAKGGLYPTLNLSGSLGTNYSGAITRRFVPDGTTRTTLTPTDFQTASGERILRSVTVPNGQFESYGAFKQWNDNLSKSLSLGLSIPIFNGLNTRSSIQKSKIALQQSEITAVEQRNTLRQSIETAYGNALAASKSFFASQRQVEALEETFRAVENQYTLGAANFTDYQVASNNLFRAKSDLARAKYDYVFKQKILDFYQGKPLTF